MELISTKRKRFFYVDGVLNFNNMSNYVDNVLIKLKRQYSKYETICALTKKLSDAEIENGKLKSYIQELEDGFAPILEFKNRLNIITKENESLKAVLKEIKKEYQPIKNKIHGNPKRNKRNVS